MAQVAFEQVLVLRVLTTHLLHLLTATHTGSTATPKTYGPSDRIPDVCKHTNVLTAHLLHLQSNAREWGGGGQEGNVSGV